MYNFQTELSSELDQLKYNTLFYKTPTEIAGNCDPTPVKFTLARETNKFFQTPEISALPINQVVHIVTVSADMGQEKPKTPVKGILAMKKDKRSLNEKVNSLREFDNKLKASRLQKLK